MTQTERIQSFLQALALGPLTLFFGIQDGICECGEARDEVPRVRGGKSKLERHNPGKHGRLKRWKDKGTSDPQTVKMWIEKYPHANLAVVTGHNSVVLDLDVRQGKDGIGELKRMAEEAGQPWPLTVSAISGSGAMHLYFKLPDDEIELKRPTGTVGIDFQTNGRAAIAPGSMHISGQYYRFAPGLSPSEVALAPIPDWLRTRMLPTIRAKRDAKSLGQYRTLEEFFEAVLKEGPPEGSKTPGRLRPDEVVLRKMKSVPMRKYPDDRSHSDSHWAWTLARNTCHHWDQYIRLWRNSPIRHLPDTKCGRVGYEFSILRKAFLDQQQQWESRRLKRKFVSHPNLRIPPKVNAIPG